MTLVAAKFIWLKILVPNKFGTTDQSIKYGFILGFARGAMLLRSMATTAVETAVTLDMENCLGSW